MEKPLAKYQGLQLNQLAEKLNIDFYAIIKALCVKAGQQLANLKMLDVHQVTKQHTRLCEELLHKLEKNLEYRQQDFLTYAHTLNRKDMEGHDCSTCGGGSCDIAHASHVMQLKESHRDICKTLMQIKATVLPIYTNAPYHGVYRMLCNELTLIDEIIQELFHLEEHELVPKILASQKKINVAG